ncbi:MAG: 6-phospho-beta-glucosidase [Firmicutes bacterium]|nr:6-phospho-beta-glucosidase [Bacillota bacterium]
MERVKIAIVGAGSTYTPELVEGFLKEARALALKQVYLFDIDSYRLRIVADLVKRMVEAKGSPFTVKATQDRKKALSNADFVLTQIRVGGQRARHADTKICLEEGLLGQETTGAVGFAKALRTIPVILELCADLKKYAAGARLINFTNPAGIVTEAIQKYGGVEAIGLCNVPVGMKMALAKDYGVSYREIDFDYVGLNHLSWVRKVFIRGEDKTAEILEKEIEAPANIPKMNINPKFKRALGMLANSYLDYFYLQDEMTARLKSEEKTRAEIVEEIEKALLKKYQDPGLAEKPKELEKRGGAHYSTVAVSAVKYIALNSGKKLIVNVRNNGALPDLGPDAVVEVTSLLDARGATALTVGRLEPEIRGLIQQVKAYEELTIEAAVRRNYNKALLALAANPLVTSVNKAQRILDRFNQEHKLGLREL